MENDWRAKAVCASTEFHAAAYFAAGPGKPKTATCGDGFHPTDTFFLGNNPKQRKTKFEKEKDARLEWLKRQACGTCPVRAECLEAEFENFRQVLGFVPADILPIGFRAGLTADDRIALSEGHRIRESACEVCGVPMLRVRSVMRRTCSPICASQPRSRRDRTPLS